MLDQRKVNLLGDDAVGLLDELLPRHAPIIASLQLPCNAKEVHECRIIRKVFALHGFPGYTTGTQTGCDRRNHPDRAGVHGFAPWASFTPQTDIDSDFPRLDGLDSSSTRHFVSMNLLKNKNVRRSFRHRNVVESFPQEGKHASGHALDLSFLETTHEFVACRRCAYYASMSGARRLWGICDPVEINGFSFLGRETHGQIESS
ncbi:MAG: hypothetical protein IIA66_09510 [Planctomycetes bacterium]|nr:hypothetical protein [Planctomycetota bacterium]